MNTSKTQEVCRGNFLDKVSLSQETGNEEQFWTTEFRDQNKELRTFWCFRED